MKKMKTTKRIVSFALAAMLLVMTSAVVASAKIVPNSLAVSLEEAGENPNIVSRSPLMNRLLQGIDSAKKSITTLKSSVANSSSPIINASWTEATGNLSKRSFPTAIQGSVSVGQTFFLNVAGPEDCCMRSGYWMVTEPSGSTWKVDGFSVSGYYAYFTTTFTPTYAGNWIFNFFCTMTNGVCREGGFTVPVTGSSQSKGDQIVARLQANHPHGSTYSGTYYEGGAARAWSCQGYAYQLAYEVYGGTPYADWKLDKSSSRLENIKPGDLIQIRLTNGVHLMFVYRVQGSILTCSDANNDYKNTIRWNVQKDKYNSNIEAVHKAPYDFTR